MTERGAWTARTVGLLVGLAVCSAALAFAVTFLNFAARAIMSIGGFVAAGGPYVIAFPAPLWAGLVPVSILGGFLFGGLSLLFSLRAGGFNLLLPVWVGLFVSLGYQFAVMGLSPPGDGGVAWGWIICAVVFVPMGLAPILLALRGEAVLRPVPVTTGWRPYHDAGYRATYWACVIAGAIVGLVGAWMLFAAVAG
ncbi:MAG: hypothetical protein U1E26_01600 [Coriobacteriia bacterium]|nr:hypothetical protein [Coriobacteriia bacterium]